MLGSLNARKAQVAPSIDSRGSCRYEEPSPNLRGPSQGLRGAHSRSEFKRVSLGPRGSLYVHKSPL